MQKWGQQRERIEHDKENAPLKWKCLKKRYSYYSTFKNMETKTQKNS